MRFEKLYERSPICLQNLMVSLKGWQIHQVRYLSLAHRRALASMEAAERHSVAILRELQFQEFRAFVEYCYEASLYYRRRFDENDLSPSDIKAPGDIGRIPITPKGDLRSE